MITDSMDFVLIKLITTLFVEHYGYTGSTNHGDIDISASTVTVIRLPLVGIQKFWTRTLVLKESRKS